MAMAAGGSSVGRRRHPAGTRMWTRVDRWARVEVVDLDKSAIRRRAALPARDLRVPGPLFSRSVSITARERSIVINLDFVRAIVTADEVLLLDPYSPETMALVDRLRRQQTELSPGRADHYYLNDHEEHSTQLAWMQAMQLPVVDDAEHVNLPFEFRVLDIALRLVCSEQGSLARDLEREAYAVLDELTKNVSTSNLDYVRKLKGSLSALLSRVQKVREEIEDLLGDSDAMADMHLSRKQLTHAPGSELSSLSRFGSRRQHSSDVEDLEMLLEAQLMQLGETRSRILAVVEYIDDTEDYVTIQQNHQRNQLLQFQMILTMASIGVGMHTLISGAFGMNIPFFLYKTEGAFWPFVGVFTLACFLVSIVLWGHARRKKLLGA